MYEDVLLVAARLAREADKRADFCSICWGPLDECPSHKGYLEMFGPPPSAEELREYLADREIRARGLDRKQKALEARARQLGYASLEDLMERTQP